jgi:hypothetical protein
MSKRPPLLAAVLVLGALGLLTGLADFRRVLSSPGGASPLQRLAEMEKFPRPHSVSWLAGLRAPVEWLDRLERPLMALTVVLLLGAFVLLAALLGPQFRLLKPDSENPGRGATAHLDVPRLLRAALGALLSLWLLGALAPLAALAPGAGRNLETGFWMLGGLPLWTAGVSTYMGPILEALLLFPLLWLIWAPGGLVSPEKTVPRSETALYGLLAGAAAAPAILALHGARFWIVPAAQSYTLADRAGWTVLLAASIAIPIAAALYLIVPVLLFRAPPQPRRVPRLVLGSLLILLLTGLGAGQIQGFLSRLDVGRSGLAQLLGLQASPLQRFALIFTPRGRILYSITADGSDDGSGQDRIAANIGTVRAVERFLEQRNYRSTLAFRGFVHLHDCASLDWHTTRSLELDVLMLERAPSPVAAQLLLEKLAHCPITPENRRILDRIAEPSRFAWPQPMGPRWLGAAYQRFGDLERARQYLLHANLSETEARGYLGGIALLTNGSVRGKATVQGQPVVDVRLGLVRVDEWRSMIGICRPIEWRRVSAFTHTDKSGRFHFQNIPEGRYVLVVTGGGIGRYAGVPSVTAHPGVIELDRFHPSRELPAIDIRFVRPIRPPGGDGGSTTA